MFCQQFKFSQADPSWFKIGGSNQWYLTALNTFPNLGSKSTGIYFFISYLVVPRLTLDHVQGRSLTILMLITLYIYLLNPKVARNLVLRFSPKPQLSTSVKFDSCQKYIFWKFRDLKANKCFALYNWHSQESTLGFVARHLKIVISSPCTKSSNGLKINSTLLGLIHDK